MKANIWRNLASSGSSPGLPALSEVAHAHKCWALHNSQKLRLNSGSRHKLAHFTLPSGFRKSISCFSRAQGSPPICLHLLCASNQCAGSPSNPTKVVVPADYGGHRPFKIVSPTNSVIIPCKALRSAEDYVLNDFFGLLRRCSFRQFGQPLQVARPTLDTLLSLFAFAAAPPSMRCSRNFAGAGVMWHGLTWAMLLAPN